MSVNVALPFIAAAFLALAACSPGPPAPAPGNAPPPDPQPAAIEAFIHTYFTTWSKGDIEGYGRCFHPDSRIWFGDGKSFAREPFLATQRAAHAQSPGLLNEVPLDWSITIRKDLAHVFVRWELTRGGGEVVRGHDFFTLVLSEGRWQILGLAFNQD